MSSRKTFMLGVEFGSAPSLVLVGPRKATLRFMMETGRIVNHTGVGLTGKCADLSIIEYGERTGRQSSGAPRKNRKGRSCLTLFFGL